MSTAIGPTDPTVASIIGLVAHVFEVTPGNIRGPSRLRGYVIPRHVAMWLAKETTHLSLPTIGRAIGRRDHTSVLHGVRRTEERMAKDPVLAGRVRTLRAMVLAKGIRTKRAAEAGDGDRVSP